MSYLVNPPSINEVTGQPEGDFQVQYRGESRDLNQVSFDPSDEPIDRDEYNDAIDPYLARRAVEANLPIFDENASDESIVAFWRSSRPLTDAEIDAIQAAYAATDNEGIANLLQWKLTGDESFLSEQQRFELGLDDYQDSNNKVEPTDLTEEMLVEFENHLVENDTGPDPEVADQILHADIGDTDEARTIQYVVHQYYSGQLNLDEAYQTALSTGLPKADLINAFNNLYTHLRNA